MIAEFRNKEFRIVELLSLGWNVFFKNMYTIFMNLIFIDFPVRFFEEIFLFQESNYQIIGIFIYVISIPLFCLSDASVIFIAERYVYGEKISYGIALAKSFSRLGSSLALTINLSFRVLPFFVLIIPGIIFWVKYYFAFHACILREKSSYWALVYSSSLVQGRWLRSCFQIISLIFIIFVPVIALLKILLDLSPQTAIICGLIFRMASYLFTVVNTVFFLNLDYRK